ncbi:MAG: Unknown protein [uncultured Campylobacterales bacterium]|uniref:Uncharacterized protein n=1 Tax=uncultured Campylobacterales bacterium TaxID=352960 RepID=A0A6S6RTT5_9BACT|nr:MAG: Unknown protein [uncultured Campylobacterales bacterium]
MSITREEILKNYERYIFDKEYNKINYNTFDIENTEWKEKKSIQNESLALYLLVTGEYKNLDIDKFKSLPQTRRDQVVNLIKNYKRNITEELISEIKLYSDNEENDIHSFINKCKDLEDQLILINTVLEMTSDINNIKQITIEQLEKFVTINDKVIKLSEHDIDTDNHGAKVTQYFDFREEALTRYGIDLPSTYPFLNPSYINRGIRLMLENIGLSATQITQIFRITGFRKKAVKRDSAFKFLKKLKEIFTKPNNIEYLDKDTLIEDPNTPKEYELLGMSEQEWYELKNQEQEEQETEQEELTRRQNIINKRQYIKNLS